MLARDELRLEVVIAAGMSTATFALGATLLRRGTTGEGHCWDGTRDRLETAERGASGRVAVHRCLLVQRRVDRRNLRELESFRLRLDLSQTTVPDCLETVQRRCDDDQDDWQRGSNAKVPGSAVEATLAVAVWWSTERLCAVSGGRAVSGRGALLMRTSTRAAGLSVVVVAFRTDLGRTKERLATLVDGKDTPNSARASERSNSHRGPLQTQVELMCSGKAAASLVAYCPHSQTKKPLGPRNLMTARV